MAPRTRSKQRKTRSSAGRPTNPRAPLKKARARFESGRRQIAGSELLASGVAHEFNNILGAADGHAEWALESGDPSKMRAALETIRVACQRSAEITRALQSFSQPREEELVDFLVADLIHEVRVFFTPLFRKKGVSMTVSLPAHAKLRGRRAALGEVISNLCKNAVEAMTGSGAPARPRVFSVVGALRASKLQLIFADTGPGVPTAWAPKLFEPFFTTKGVLQHLSASTPQPPAPAFGGGAGLGLYLSKQIVEEHGGSLRLLPKATAEGGARFLLELKTSK